EVNGHGDEERSYFPGTPFSVRADRQGKKKKKSGHLQDALRRGKRPERNLVVDGPEPQRQGYDLYKGRVRQHVPAVGKDRAHNRHEEKAKGKAPDNNPRSSSDNRAR